MKYFEASFASILIRFYLMMGVAVIAGFTGTLWLAILCVPLFLSAMLGVKFDFAKSVQENKRGTMEIAKSSSKSITEAA